MQKRIDYLEGKKNSYRKCIFPSFLANFVHTNGKVYPCNSRRKNTVITYVLQAKFNNSFFMLRTLIISPLL